MTEVLRDLAVRLRSELCDLARTSQLAERRWQKAMGDEDYLGSVVLDLQSFYQGVERSFELIAKVIDGRLPSGPQWHLDLLEQMSTEIEGVRPAVISSDTKTAIDRLRKFRHVARNVYAFSFNPEKISGLVVELPLLLELVRNDLDTFAEFIETVTPG